MGVMVRRSILPMVLAARRLPWHVELSPSAGGLGLRLNCLLDWCRASFAAEAWFWPGPGNLWCFAERAMAEAFAAEAERVTDQRPSLRDSRGTAEPPWGS
jgi:hypothetical protein